MNRNKGWGNTINMIVINTYYFFRSFFMIIIQKSNLTTNRYGELLISVIITIRKLIEKERTKEKILMKTLGTSKNHSGWIDLIHSSMLDREHSIIRTIHLSFWDCPLESNYSTNLCNLFSTSGGFRAHICCWTSVYFNSISIDVFYLHLSNVIWLAYFKFFFPNWNFVSFQVIFFEEV